MAENVALLAELRQKMALERTARREIRTLLRSIQDDVMNGVRLFGGFTPRPEYKDRWTRYLGRHYARVQKAFAGKFLERPQLKQEDIILQQVLEEWRRRASFEKAGLIAQTTDQEIAQAIEQARLALEEEGNLYTNTALALATIAILEREFDIRADAIALTETQSPAESTKLLEATLYAGLATFVLPGVLLPQEQQRRIVKTWQTVGDSRVRPSHVAINGNTIAVEEVFVLNTGSRLRFPTDLSFLASPADTINCRCSAVYTEV